MTISPASDDVLDHRCETCPARHHAICSVLENQHCHALSDIMVHKHFKHGQTLWGDEDDAHVIAIVVAGTVKLLKMLADGRQQIVGLLFPSDCFGRAFSETQHSFAEAATDVEICCFPRPKFEQVLRQHPELEHALLEKTLNDLDRARDWMVGLGRKTAGEKVASFLSEMARKSELTKCTHDRPSPNLPTFVLPLTRGEIADCLGLTIETVSRTLTKLRVNGVIRLINTHTIEVCDPDALAGLGDPD
ncbi:MAG: helix-turn-helix domain-containing protein [Planctomycetaceae bacterium]|nr:helix-turn-helix domain-containing protein [Planctomycetaceae bacterium]